MAGEWREATVGALCDAGVAELQTGPFGSQLHAYDASAAAREARTLAALRDTLLPKLLSGEIRVGDADRLVQAAT